MEHVVVVKRLKGYGLLSYYSHGKSTESKVMNIPVHVSDGIHDILNMHNVEILKKQVK